MSGFYYLLKNIIESGIFLVLFIIKLDSTAYEHIPVQKIGDTLILTLPPAMGKIVGQTEFFSLG